MQAQVSLRPTAGVSTRNDVHVEPESRNGSRGRTKRDRRDLHRSDQSGRRLHSASTHREHVVRQLRHVRICRSVPQSASSGNRLESPRGSWKTGRASWIVNLSSGAPLNVSAQSMLYGNRRAGRRRPIRQQKLQGGLGQRSTQRQYLRGLQISRLCTRGCRDPQCTNSSIVAPSLQTRICTLNGLRNNSSGQVVLQTPLPGNRGTLGRNAIEGLGTWSADMAIQKRIQIAETKSFTLRVDARNIFNHPTPALPGLFATTGGTADLNLQSTRILSGPSPQNRKSYVPGSGLVSISDRKLFSGGHVTAAHSCRESGVIVLRFLSPNPVSSQVKAYAVITINLTKDLDISESDVQELFNRLRVRCVSLDGSDDDARR